MMHSEQPPDQALEPVRNDQVLARIERAEENILAALKRVVWLEAWAKQQVAAFEEALTPSGATKAAYIGEFHFNFRWTDEEGDEQSDKVDVPWTAVKEIMAAIARRAQAGRTDYSEVESEP